MNPALIANLKNSLKNVVIVEKTNENKVFIKINCKKCDTYILSTSEKLTLKQTLKKIPKICFMCECKLYKYQTTKSRHIGTASKKVDMSSGDATSFLMTNL